MTIAYTGKFLSFVPAASGAWTDKDLFTDHAVPKGAVAEIVCENAQAAATNNMGVRIRGSALTRTMLLDEAEPSGGTHLTMHVQTDANGKIEYWVDTTTGATFYVLGWWTGCTYTEFPCYTIANAMNSTWEDSDVSEDVPVDRVLEILATNYEPTISVTAGVRTGGSALSRYISIHEAEGGGAQYFTFMVKTNKGIIQTYTTVWQYPFVLLGYFSIEMDFHEDWQSITPSGTVDTWQDWDLTAFLDEDGRVGHFIMGHSNTVASRLIGIRINAGLATYGTRRVTEHEAEGNFYTGLSMCAKSDASSIVEYYVQTTNADYNINFDGYFFDYVAPPAPAIFPVFNLKGRGGDSRSKTNFVRTLKLKAS